MKINFTKMHGCGNDYIYIDCFTQTIENPAALAVKLSDRHKGIGGDGVILICPSEVATAKMRMFNLDGSEGKMCGNGIRCVAEYLFINGKATGGDVTIETLAGIKHIVRKAEGLLAADIGAPILEPKLIPVSGFNQPIINQLVEVNGGGVYITCVSMGNPHCVIFVPSTGDELNVQARGRQMESTRFFPEGANTEFVQVVDETHLNMRVWERGSGETLACGTGACASVVAAVLCGFCKKDTDVDVALLGGTLTIRYTGETVWMTGNAVTVFTGCVDVE